MDSTAPWLQLKFREDVLAACRTAKVTLLDADLSKPDPTTMSPRTEAQLEVLYKIVYGRKFLSSRSRVVTAVLGTGAGKTLLITLAALLADIIFPLPDGRARRTVVVIPLMAFV